MVKGFEEITAPLTEKEKNIFLPMVRRILVHRIGEDYAITNFGIRDICLANEVKISSAQVRKVVNILRRLGLPTGILIAGRAGYWVETDEKKINNWLEGMEERVSIMASSISAVRRQKLELKNNVQLKLFQ